MILKMYLQLEPYKEIPAFAGMTAKNRISEQSQAADPKSHNNKRLFRLSSVAACGVLSSKATRGKACSSDSSVPM